MSNLSIQKECVKCKQGEFVDKKSLNEHEEFLCSICSNAHITTEEGDRMCPNCDTMNLVEKGLTQWECLKCKKVYDEEYLDSDIEVDE